MSSFSSLIKELLYICIFCGALCGCIQRKAQNPLEPLKTEIRHIIKDKKATIGVALILDGEDTLAVNNAEKYPMMSVYKFHQALAVCDYLQKRHIPLSTSLYLDKGISNRIHTALCVINIPKVIWNFRLVNF